MNDFEEKVIKALTRLETQMYALVGNGQPGRLAHLEAKVRRHERLIWIAIGFAAAGGYGLSEILKRVFGGGA